MAEVYDVTADELREADVTEFDEDDLSRQYDDMLDECYGPFEIGCCTFYASRVLEELDPIAYRCGFSDWLDSERDRLVEVDGCYFDASEVDAYEPEVGECDECGDACPIDDDLCEDCEEELKQTEA